MELIIIFLLVSLFFLVKTVTSVVRGVSYIFCGQSSRQNGRQYGNTSYFNGEQEFQGDHKNKDESGKVFGRNEGQYVTFEEVKD